MQGFILYATTIYVVLFLIVDLLYIVIDPRIRSAPAAGMTAVDATVSRRRVRARRAR